MRIRRLLPAVVSCLFALMGPFAATTVAAESRLVREGRDGKLVYLPWTGAGDTIPDFSNCGFGGGGTLIPVAAVNVTVVPQSGGGDDTLRIQEAIDRVAALPMDSGGLRGAVLLRKGVYRVRGTLKIARCGVVLRGEGSGENGTVLVATGTKQRSLIDVGGSVGTRPLTATRQVITDPYVPVGAREFTIADASGFKVGDSVFVIRHGNAAWIRTLGMDAITPRKSSPGSTRNWSPFDLPFDRVITAVSGNRVSIDAPMACAIDERWGGGEIVAYIDERIERVGVENLRADSEFDPAVTREGKDDNGEVQSGYAADEAHATRLVTFNHVKNAWARDLVAVHFYHGVSDIAGGAKWVTVEDSSSIDPVSVITGGRRYPFAVEGQLNLVQRCYSRDGRHAFVVGSRVPGPNVFLFCRSERDHATSEPHHRWSVGGLYDGVRAEIIFQDRQWMGSGHGWAGANYVAWNTEGSLVCQQPPTAQNFAIGHVGERRPGAFVRPAGYWESHGQHVSPRSLYLKQLEDRLGAQAVKRIGYPDAGGGRGS